MSARIFIHFALISSNPVLLGERERERERERWGERQTDRNRDTFPGNWVLSEDCLTDCLMMPIFQLAVSRSKIGPINKLGYGFTFTEIASVVSSSWACSLGYDL